MTSLDVRMLHELEPFVAEGLEHHLTVATDWMPHDYVPWSRGRDFALLGGQDWQPEDSALSPVAKASMILNLLTEDNLPSYHKDIADQFGRSGAWGEWVHRWTAEEARHSIVLRDYLVVTRGVDPVELEQRRMAHVSQGYLPEYDSVLQNLAYTTVQELATRVSHRNTGRASGCPVAEKLMARVSMDENLHMVFYRRLGELAFDIEPDATMRAVADQLMAFEMPGAGQPDFARNAVAIAVEGIYDLALHRREVIDPLLRRWRVFDREDLGPEGERARAELETFLTALDRRVERFVERRDAARERRARQEERAS